jgi:hypothetical protein
LESNFTILYILYNSKSGMGSFFINDRLYSIDVCFQTGCTIYRTFIARFFVYFSDVFLSFINDISRSGFTSIFFNVDERLIHSCTKKDKDVCGEWSKDPLIVGLRNMWSQVVGFTLWPLYPRGSGPSTH